MDGFIAIPAEMRDADMGDLGCGMCLLGVVVQFCVLAIAWWRRPLRKACVRHARAFDHGDCARKFVLPAVYPMPHRTPRTQPLGRQQAGAVASSFPPTRSSGQTSQTGMQSGTAPPRRDDLLSESNLNKLVIAIRALDSDSETAVAGALTRPYVTAIDEVCGLFALFGLNLSFITMKLREYAVVIREREEDYRRRKTLPPSHGVRLHELVQDEITSGVTRRNEGKRPADGRRSASRSLLRLMRFGDFFLAIFNNLSSRPDMTFSQCAQAAYSQTLRRQQSLPMQAGVCAVLKLLPGRSAFFGKLRLRDDTATMNQLRELNRVLLDVNSQLWDMYRREGIDNLK